YHPLIEDNPLNSPIPQNSNILLHLPISHNLNHLNHKHLNWLTYLNLKTLGLMMDKKVNANFVRPRKISIGGGVSVVEMDRNLKQKSCESLDLCLGG
ncbi:hypothetical protein GIB67_011302, partial [Kingdonia uniflora]